MKTRKINRILIFGILFLFSSLFLWNCQQEQPLIEQLEVNQVSKLNFSRSFLSEHYLKIHKPDIYENLSGLMQKYGSKSNREYTDEYNFEYSLDHVQMIETEDFTQYSLEVVGSGTDATHFENYVFMEYTNGEEQQFLFTFEKVATESGYEIDHNKTQVQILEGTSIFAKRCVGGMELVDVEMSTGCTEIVCTGTNGHGLGDDCPCGEVYDCTPPSLECGTMTIQTWRACSGDGSSTGNPDGTEPTGGGGNTGSGNNDGNNNNNDIPIIPVEDLRLHQFIDSLTVEQKEWWNTPGNRTDTVIRLFLEAEDYSDPAQNLARDVIDIFRDTSLTDDQRFLEFINIYDVYDPPLDISASATDFEERIREYAKQFRRRGQEEFANYLESIIPFHPSTTIGEILDLFEVIRAQNLRLFYEYLREITVTTIVSFEPVIEVALIAMGGRFALALLQRIPSAYVTTYIANVITRLGIPASTAYTAFLHAQKFGIQTFTQLQQEFVNLGLSASQMNVQFHHLIEQRFSGVPGVSQWLGASTNNWNSIVLTTQEHQVFTNAWRAAISTNNMNNPGWTNTFTYNATIEDVKEAARQIYANYPEILEALGL